MKNEILRQIEGYEEVVREKELASKYGTDYSLEKGHVQETIDRLHPLKLNMRVAEIIEETPTARTIRLVSPGRILPPFQAGQYIALYAKIGKILTGRAYSLSSPPNQTGYYDITVRRVEGGFVSDYLLGQVKTGDVMGTSGPSGNLYFNPLIHDRTSVFIAGGSGITPFMSMIREIVDCGLDREVFLFYGNRSEGDIIFRGELERIAKGHKNIRYIPVIEEPDAAYKGARGYITGDLIKRELGDLSGKTYYLCGPSAMYDFVLPEIERLGIPGRKIRREMYGAPRSISRAHGWPSGISEDSVFEVKLGGGRTIKARAGEPLLNSLERNGIVVPSLCRSGECSMCRVKLVSGKVFQPEGVLLRASDRRFGYIHSCAAYPVENLEILV